MISLFEDPEFNHICKVSFAIEDNDHRHLTIGAILNHTDPWRCFTQLPFPLRERKKLFLCTGDPVPSLVFQALDLVNTFYVLDFHFSQKY